MIRGDTCHHGLIRETCSVCLHGVSRGHELRVLRHARARFRSCCLTCREPIEVYQPVAQLEDHSWRHEECL